MKSRLRSLDDRAFGRVVWTAWGPRRSRPVRLVLVTVVIFGVLAGGLTAANGPLDLLVLLAPVLGVLVGRFVTGEWAWRVPRGADEVSAQQVLDRT